MLEIAFNELSLNTRTTTKAHAVAVIEQFFEIADNINQLKISPLRIRADRNFYTVNLCDHNQFFNIKEWLKTVSNEKRQRYVAYVVQQKVLSNNPYHIYQGQFANGFGYSYENKTISISINVGNNWCEDAYRIERQYLEDSPEAEVQVDQVSVDHCPSAEKVNKFVPILEEFVRDSRKEALRSFRDINDFWDKKNILFPKLIFTDNVKDLIQKYGSPKHPDLKKALSFLRRLNEHLSKAERGEASFDEYPGDFSPESESTLNEFGDLRRFKLPNGSTETFNLHAKPGNSVRVHFLPDAVSGICYIGYIGIHLSTAKAPK